MARTTIDILAELLFKEGNKAILYSKYMNMTIKEIEAAYNKINLQCPIKIIENDWLISYRSADRRNGWGNGYVLVPKGHKYYGLNYDDIPVDVHGGLTFSKHIKGDERGNFSDGFWIGFDTAHHNDTLDKWSENKVLEETINLFKQIYHL